MRVKAIFAAIILCVSSAAFAHEYKVGSLEIAHPWVRTTKPGASVAGGFLEVTNKGNEADILLSVSSDVAPTIQLHTMSMENNVMKMAEVEDGLEIKPGETLVLKPKGLHIMFMGLQKPLLEKEKIAAQLTFAKAGIVQVEFAVEKSDSDGNHH